VHLKRLFNRFVKSILLFKRPPWPWSYDSWIYNYRCNQCLSPLMLYVRISIRARCTTSYDKVCYWLATGPLYSLNTPVSSTNKTDRHDITELLLKVVLSTLKCIWNISIFLWIYWFLKLVNSWEKKLIGWYSIRVAP
jgi:hypothetical protein